MWISYQSTWKIKGRIKTELGSSVFLLHIFSMIFFPLPLPILGQYLQLSHIIQESHIIFCSCNKMKLYRRKIVISVMFNSTDEKAVLDFLYYIPSLSVQWLGLLPSCAEVAGLIPGVRARIPHALRLKHKNIKQQKQYCNQFYKDLNGPHKTKTKTKTKNLSIQKWNNQHPVASESGSVSHSVLSYSL